MSEKLDRASTRRWGLFKPGKRWWGFERSTIYISDEKYMDRWILYVGGGTIRLHKFYRGDDDRASHTHPWWFITFPFSDYVETVYVHGTEIGPRIVKAFRPHFRAADFEHIVEGRPDKGRWVGTPDMRPFWTLVVSGTRQSAWGFFPSPNHFVSWREYR